MVILRTYIYTLALVSPRLYITLDNSPSIIFIYFLSYRKWKLCQKCQEDVQRRVHNCLMSLLYTPYIFQVLNNLSWIITVWWLIIRKIKENTLSSPIADDNFVIIPIFNPSTYSTSLCCPLNTNRLILLCHSKIKNVVSTIISRTSAGSTHQSVKFFAGRNKFGYDW